MKEYTLEKFSMPLTAILLFVTGKTNVKFVKFEEVGPEGNGHIGISKHEDFDKVVQEAVLAAHDFSKKN